MLFLTAGCFRDKVYTRTNESQSGRNKNNQVAQNTENTALQVVENKSIENTGSQNPVNPDRKVEDFLNSRIRSWRDANVPYADGKLLHDIIVDHNYQHAVEIGTSTGHSAIWIAWALSKTGGRLITGIWLPF